MADLTREQIMKWLESEENEFYIEPFRKKHDISPESSTLYVTLGRLCKERVLKSLGRGLYRKVKRVEPIRWHLADEGKFLELAYPKSRDDNTEFGFEDYINLSPGDLIVVGGVSNYGKSALVLNIMGENVDKYEFLLMGNEYATLGGRPSPKFKRRMMRMNWVNWLNGEGEPKFTLLPIRANFEDYIEPDKINIIDWINLTTEFYRIGQIIEDIKAGLGDGLAIIVLQKEEEAEMARGKGFTRDLADVYFTIDPFGDWQSRLTVGKVKDYKKRITGRMWGFSIVDGGANLHNIREIKKCPDCRGKGYIRFGQGYKPCEGCEGLKYLDI